MKYARMFTMLCLLLIPVCAFSAVELYKVSSSTSVPAYVYYTLNCTASVTFEIFPSDASGSITGPKVRTDTQSGVVKGPHTYLWPGTRDDGTPAPYGYYVCKLTASVSESSFRKIIGSYKADENVTEYASWIPPVADVWGYYGASINTNPDSPYYGRIYAGNVNDQQVYMWDCDGTFLGALDDTGIGWGATAPWDLYVARDGYVYVSDRSNTKIYCFPPDGGLWVSSGNGTWPRSLFVSQTPGDITHIYLSSGATVLHCTVSADHLTWTPPEQVANPPDEVWGVWVSPDRTVMYLVQSGGTVAKWNKGSGESFTQDAGWSCPVTNALDVCGTPDGNYLWIGRFVASSSGPVAKYPVAGGSPIYYNGTPYVKGVQTDSVGNILITYGKSANSWPSYYWCLATEPGSFTAVKQTGPFELIPCLPPIVVPGSATWTLPGPCAPPDGVTPISVSFKVMDGNGWQDIAGVKIDLSSVKMASDPNPIVDVDSMIQDTTDPNDLTVICSKTFTVVPGAKAGQHIIRVEPMDISPYCEPVYEDLYLDVCGATFTGTVRHTRHNAAIAGATMTLIGGKVGVYGYPFTYTTGLTGSNGQASVSISEGSFTVTASKIGYKTQAPLAFTALPGDISGSIAMDVYLGPLTIAEAKALPSGTTASVEGVCYAQPKGLAPTAACGLDRRLYSVSGTTGPMYNQWYMCDPANASSGALFMLRPTSDPGFPFTWDDPSKVDDYGYSVYIGPRVSEGDTICATVDFPSVPVGQEKRFVVKDSEFLAEIEDTSYYKTYLNRGNLGGLPSAPVSLTIPQLASSWGKYGKVRGYVIGQYTVHPGGPISWTIADSSGNLGSITLDTPSSLCMTLFAPQVGGLYDFTGAVGRRPDSGSTVRIRKQSDASLVSPPTTPGELSTIRNHGTGYPVDVSGVVTLKGSSYLYIEAEDCSVGVRVAAAPSYVSVNDKVQVIGDLGLEDGEKIITPTEPISVMGGGSVPALVLRTMDVGGEDYGPNDPGITYGRGPLNVGLLVRLFGRVTARDPGGQWFYVWDGANMLGGITPLDDGTGNLGTRIISTFAVIPGTDFVRVTGVVSTNTTTVPGRVIPEILPTETPVRLYP